LRQIGEWPILPVIHRADFNNLQGIISIADILAAYGAASDEGSTANWWQGPPARLPTFFLKETGADTSGSVELLPRLVSLERATSAEF